MTVVFTPAEFGAIILHAEQMHSARGMTQEEIASALGIRLERGVKGWIYFVQPGDVPVVKIGFASKIGQRLCSMRTDNHLPLRVLIAFQGTQWSESTLHALYCKHRVRGEWFRLDGKLEAKVAHVRAHANPEMLASWDAMVGRS